ncbi:uncharacterized protein LOC106081141 [Stomoxys calcitrans]|uniref:uncharacterized protein LOC106081141 n=1 Tax=Stomoxys calcitrans TaxID=35570 RepID=UPI0027E2512A|nr:uncharacterized protein LOC106081141 [Stomoxys calcitrans]
MCRRRNDVSHTHSVTRPEIRELLKFKCDLQFMQQWNILMQALHKGFIVLITKGRITLMSIKYCECGVTEFLGKYGAYSFATLGIFSKPLKTKSVNVFIPLPRHFVYNTSICLRPHKVYIFLIVMTF